jgi:hypothetical protein
MLIEIKYCQNLFIFIKYNVKGVSINRFLRIYQDVSKNGGINVANTILLTGKYFK